MRQLKKLREVMKKHNIDYYIIPSADAHQSEYVAEHYRGRAYISGFTGSAGTLLVGQQNAKLWTDGRYFIQAENQLKDTGIELMKIATEGYDTLAEWIENNIKEGETLGFFGKCYSVKEYRELLELSNKNKFKLNIDEDLLERVWDNRPELPMDNIFIHDVKYCGKSASVKIKEVREKMNLEGVDNFLLSSLDDIAWLFNIRGNDILFNPVVMAFAIVSKESTKLFINSKKISLEVKSYLENEGVALFEYDDIYIEVGKLDGKTLIDPLKVNSKLYTLLKSEVVENSNITTIMKAIKNETEINSLDNCQIKDGVAMVKFIKWLKENVGQEKVTEISASEKLSSFRAEMDLAKGDSFGTIAGYKEHAAMMHYSATEESDCELKQEGMFLVDSGGQYFDGTTDITRTFILGPLTEEEKRDFTLVLKGHINLASAKFLKGTTGVNLDVLARGPLWKYGIDYKCGTGHGVGFFLNVHEGPQGIRPRGNSEQLQPGMILTNEPGVYKEGKFGIRTENMMIVEKDETTESGEFYKFRTITYCPIDLNGLKINLLTEEEKLWLNRYHRIVLEKLSPYLNKEEREFLKEETREI